MKKITVRFLRSGTFGVVGEPDFRICFHVRCV